MCPLPKWSRGDLKNLLQIKGFSGDFETFLLSPIHLEYNVYLCTLWVVHTVSLMFFAFRIIILSSFLSRITLPGSATAPLNWHDKHRAKRRRCRRWWHQAWLKELWMTRCSTDWTFIRLFRSLWFITAQIPTVDSIKAVFSRRCHFIFLPVGRFLLLLSWFRTWASSTVTTQWVQTLNNLFLSVFSSHKKTNLPFNLRFNVFLAAHL